MHNNLHTISFISHIGDINAATSLSMLYAGPPSAMAALPLSFDMDGGRPRRQRFQRLLTMIATMTAVVMVMMMMEMEDGFALNVMEEGSYFWWQWLLIASLLMLPMMMLFILIFIWNVLSLCGRVFVDIFGYSLVLVLSAVVCQLSSFRHLYGTGAGRTSKVSKLPTMVWVGVSSPSTSPSVVI